MPDGFNLSCIIYFHRVKFFPSNFWISTFVLDCVVIFLKVDVIDLVFSLNLKFYIG